MGIFLSQHFKYPTAVSSCMHSFWWKVGCSSWHCSSTSRIFPSDVFQDFLFLIFCCNEYDMSRCIFFHSSYLMFYEVPGSVVWCLSLVLGNSQSLWLQIFFLFLSFLSSWYSHYVYVTSLVIVPWFGGILVFFIFFYLPVGLDTSLASVTVPLAVSSLLMSPAKAVFIFVTEFWFLTFPFNPPP